MLKNNKNFSFCLWLLQDEVSKTLPSFTGYIQQSEITCFCFTACYVDQLENLRDTWGNILFYSQLKFRNKLLFTNGTDLKSAKTTEYYCKEVYVLFLHMSIWQNLNIWISSFPEEKERHDPLHDSYYQQS